jgi:hypothetical protein
MSDKAFRDSRLRGAGAFKIPTLNTILKHGPIIMSISKN